MRTIWRLILFSLMASTAYAQSTTVSATVVDQSSTTWANGSWALDFVPNPNAGSPPFWNGNPFPSTQWHYGGQLDGSGHFSQSVPSNNFITPAGSTYTVTVCPNATAPCSTILRETFQGTSMDISTVITANTPAPTVKPSPVAVAYNDNQVSVNNSLVGYFYMNSTSNVPRYWNGIAWNAFGGTIGGITIGSLPPLFTTTTGGTITNPAFSFTAPTQIANLIYGNCSGVTNIPSFCALTNSMLPGILTANTTGNANTASQSDHTPTLCTGNNFAIGVGALWNASCQQPAFLNLSGNISVGQMNNGTNANATHYWRGDQTWATIPTVPNVQNASATSTCTTGASSYSACSVSINWPVSFADSAYQAVCFGVSPSDSRAYIDGILTKTPTGVTVQVVTGGSVAVTYGTVDCIAVHP